MVERSSVCRGGASQSLHPMWPSEPPDRREAVYSWSRIVLSSVTRPPAVAGTKRDGHIESEALSMHGVSAQHGGIAQGGTERAIIQRSGGWLGDVLIRGT